MAAGPTHLKVQASKEPGLGQEGAALQAGTGAPGAHLEHHGAGEPAVHPVPGAPRHRAGCPDRAPGARAGQREALGGVAAALLSSAGPWWCLANVLHHWRTRTTYTYDKVEC